jgi:hypothetical protein
MISPEGTRHLPGDNQERKIKARPRLAETLKREFRALVRAITHHAPAPQPTARRRSTEDTGKAFRMTARKIMRRTARIPSAAYAAATSYLWDTLDWLNPCRYEVGSAGEPDEDLQHGEQHHLSPHL